MTYASSCTTDIRLRASATLRLDTSTSSVNTSTSASSFGALLPDPAHLLEGTGWRGRHVKLAPGRKVDPTALAQLVEAAFVDVSERLSR